MSEPYARHIITSSNGTRLAAQSWGKPDGPPILFLHAFGMGHWAWWHQIGSDLAKTHRLVTFDHRGHGDSDRPTDSEAYADGALFAADIAAVIAELGLSRPAVVAWSMSGALLGDYLSQHGDANLSAITLIGAVNALGEPMMASGQLGSIFADPLANAIHDPATEEAGFAHINRGLTTGAADPELWVQIQASSLKLPVAARGAILMRGVDHLETYRSTSVPMLVIHAENDPIVSIAAADRVLTARPDATHIRLTSAAHAPHREDAATVNMAIQALLAKGR
jgi:non-heme chloroperoxidase